MNWFKETLFSTVGQKIIMSITGLFLISFLLVHLTGNLMLFNDDNGAAFNTYAHFMSTAKIVRIAEIILVLAFVLHIYTAWRLTQLNRQTRSKNYICNSPNSNSSWTSHNMGFAGTILLIFLVIHLHNFWFRYKFQVDIPLAAGTDYQDMYWLVHEIFTKEWWFSIVYLVAMIFFGFHLAHGFESALQTLGIHHYKYTPLLKKIGLLLAIAIPAGFATMPIYFFFQ